ncbi:uncharacterized protein TNCV_3441401 [Trichonephila clavipes]|uniref:Uncharacterized protein n=1 Tax=Trichonephila clavipes TaxID=2585209 RepID=A0A8X7BEX5_TRICX|nr:uncharacterized protein TNCV_3441401 [Trichonephila clavipes]
MPPDRQQHQIKAHKIHLGKGLVIRMSLAIALSTIQLTVRCDLVPPQFKGRTSCGGQRLPTSLPLPPSSRLSNVAFVARRVKNSRHVITLGELEVRDLELEVNEDDIEELIMGHEDELTIEEPQEILNEVQQETQRNVSPSEQEEDERGPMPTSAIQDLSKK